MPLELQNGLRDSWAKVKKGNTPAWRPATLPREVPSPILRLVAEDLLLTQSSRSLEAQASLTFEAALNCQSRRPRHSPALEVWPFRSWPWFSCGSDSPVDG